jgi:hypothetical protein
MKTKQLQAATVSNLCDIPIRTLGAAAGRAACLIIQATTMAAGNSTGTAVAGSILTDGRGSRPTDHRRQDAAAEAGYSDLEGLAGTTPPPPYTASCLTRIKRTTGVSVPP